MFAILDVDRALKYLGPHRRTMWNIQLKGMFRGEVILAQQCQPEVLQIALLPSYHHIVVSLLISKFTHQSSSPNQRISQVQICAPPIGLL